MLPTASFCIVSREDYPDFRRISVDGVAMADDYDEFVSEIVRSEIEMKERGVTVTRVYIKPTELLNWCKTQNRPVDGNARAEFAVRKVIEMEKNRDVR